MRVERRALIVFLAALMVLVCGDIANPSLATAHEEPTTETGWVERTQEDICVWGEVQTDHDIWHAGVVAEMAFIFGFMQSFSLSCWDPYRRPPGNFALKMMWYGPDGEWCGDTAWFTNEVETHGIVINVQTNANISNCTATGLTFVRSGHYVWHHGDWTGGWITPSGKHEYKRKQFDIVKGS